MDIQRQKQRIQDVVVKPMLAMIHEYEWDEYTEADVADCQALLEKYVEALAALPDPSDAAILAQVKQVVLALNEWNEPNDFIGTEEREWLWEVIQQSAVDCGLKHAPDDVTEAWREW